jgi:hypothetical protein
VKALFVSAFFILAVCLSSSARTEKVPGTVTAQRDGDIHEHQYFADGTAHVRRSYTNYIIQISNRGEKILLTIT